MGTSLAALKLQECGVTRTVTSRNEEIAHILTALYLTQKLPIYPGY